LPARKFLYLASVTVYLSKITKTHINDTSVTKMKRCHRYKILDFFFLQLLFSL
jgi:hypothetical protein